MHSSSSPLPSPAFPHLARLHINDLLKVGLDKNSLDLLGGVGGVGGDDGDEERVVVLQQVLVEPVLGRLRPGLTQQGQKYYEERQHAVWLAGWLSQTVILS